MAESFRKTSFLDDFDIPEITPEAVKSQLIKTTKSVAVKKNNSIESMPLRERLKYIKDNVNKTLGRYKGFVKVLYGEKEVSDYIDKAIEYGYLSFDTETNRSLDPLTCKLMGLCCYIPNTKPVYIPMNHVNPDTNERLPNQIDEDFARQIFQRLKDSDIKMIYHNGKFDIRVCYNVTGVYLPIWWDTMIASQLLDENEQAKLKVQYKNNVDPTISSYNIEKLFNLPYELVDVETFALYAAIDAYDTWKLQQYQQKEFEKEDLHRLYKLFTDIEVPTVLVTAEMEDTGICLDLDFINRLNSKYEKEKDRCLKKLNELCVPYESAIREYQRLGKLDNPVNYDSSTQLNIILYDIMHCKVSEQFGKSGKSDVLKEINNDFTNAILDYRHYSKLISGFTQPLPGWLSKRDGKLHASFNQMGKEEKGVRTGRFSSTDPNLQQIPSHEKTMRLAFKASPGCVIVGSDYSAQEPRLMTYLSGDPTLRETFENNRDPYATLCAPAFHLDYWDCMEHTKDGKPNPDGKKMRSKGKILMLGISYGMGAAHMANSMGLPFEECKEVLKNFYETFPKIKEFGEKNERDVVEKLYVEDYMGRRRHLPDANLDEVVITQTKKVHTDADLFMNVSCISKENKLKENELNVKDIDAINYWTSEWKNVENSKDMRMKKSFKKALKDNKISYIDNSGFISKTRTQCTNARIQGSAATLTKKAMVAIHNDKRMRELGFKLLIPVHDELLGECPAENAEEVSKRLSELMINATKPEVNIKFKCDPYIARHWYADEVENEIFNSYNQMIVGNADKGIEKISSEDAIKKLKVKYSELSENVVEDMCFGKFDAVGEMI